MSETRRAAIWEWYQSTLSSRLDSKTEDVIVKAAWFPNYARPPERRPGDQIVQSWDTASNRVPAW